MTDAVAPDLHENLRNTAAAAIEGVRLIRTAKRAPMLRLALATELARALGLPEDEFIAIAEGKP